VKIYEGQEKRRMMKEGIKAGGIVRRA